MAVDLDFPVNSGCDQESTITVHAKSSSEKNKLGIFAVQCVIKRDPVTAVVCEAHLNVHSEFMLVPCQSARVYVQHV